ncbi:MAG: hypothetical protein L0H70_07860, partial [Xanthomonadales bacterium]|nr:hypothetical protein [Xanthomonadales bacterium]
MRCAAADATKLRELSWDGQTFRIDADFNGAMQLHVDGQLCARGPAQSAAVRLFHFTCAPGGQDAMQL